ncbi:MAG: hypothetical protein ABGY42_04690 [bacterium]
MHLVGEAELLRQIAVVDFNVTRFVRHLVGRVVLRLLARHRLDNFRGCEQRALLTMQKLPEHEGVVVQRELAHHFVGERLRRVHQLIHHLGHAVVDAILRNPLQIDLGVPR